MAGVACVDRLSGQTIDVAAKAVVNATGGAIDRLLGSVGISTGIPMLKAMNLVTTREAGDAALGGRSASGRNLFLVPWRRRALFGTWESRTVCTPDQAAPTEQEVASFITELNEAFPALDLQRSDVSLVHRGVVPAVNDVERCRAGRAAPGSRPCGRRRRGSSQRRRHEVHDRAGGGGGSRRFRCREADRHLRVLPDGGHSAARRPRSRRRPDDRRGAPRLRQISCRATRSPISSPPTDRAYREVVDLARTHARVVRAARHRLPRRSARNWSGRCVTRWP